MYPAGSEPARGGPAGRARLRAVHHAVPALQRTAARARYYCGSQVSPYM